MSVDIGARKRASRAKKLANNALANTVTAQQSPGFPSMAALQAATIPSNVNYVRVLSYYADGLEINSGALWQRSPVQSSGLCRRRSADGAYWQIAEIDIDPRMNGARNSDRTFDSTFYINEALRFANQVSVSGPGVGARRIVFGPGQQQAYDTLGSAYCISSEILLRNGVSIEQHSGCEILCLPGFTGEFAFASDTGSLYGNGASIKLRGTINCNNVTSGIGLRSGAGVVVDTMGSQIINCTLYGLRVGIPGNKGGVFECKFLLGEMMATPVRVAGDVYCAYNNITASDSSGLYALAGTANNPNSVGVCMTSGSSDNRIFSGEMVGFYTGYQDDGASNHAQNLHPYTAGLPGTGHPTFYGPMVNAFVLNGGAGGLSNLVVDTPTAMNNSAIPYVYGLTFGTNANSYVVKGLTILMQYDNISNNTGGYQANGQPGGCIGICDNSNNYSGANSVDGVNYINTGPLLFYQGVGSTTGKSPMYTARSNVYAPGKFVVSFSPQNQDHIASKVTPYQLVNFADNPDFFIAQNGTSSINVNSAARIRTVDRWFSDSDGTITGTRTVQQVPITTIDMGNSGVPVSGTGLRITQTGTSGTGTYWRITQRFPVDFIQSMGGINYKVDMLARLASGTFPNGQSVNFGHMINFGSGGAATDSRSTFLTAPTSTNFGNNRTGAIFINNVFNKTIGTGAYFEWQIILPITGNFDIVIGQMLVTYAPCATIWPIPDHKVELNKALTCFQKVNTININGTYFCRCAPKITTFSTAATVGTVGTATSDGALITDTGQNASVVTFDTGY